MGWWFTQGDTKESLTHKYLQDKNVIDHSLVDNNLWLLTQSGENRVICLVMMKWDRTCGYGSKDLDETMGPYVYTCPVRLIQKATEPLNDTAREWRRQVKILHKQKADRPKWKTGDRVRWWNGRTFTLAEKRRNTWWTTDNMKVTINKLNKYGKL